MIVKKYIPRAIYYIDNVGSKYFSTETFFIDFSNLQT